MLNFVKNRRTMEIPRNCPDLIATLMQDCWAYEAEDRPTFVDICKRLLDYANEEFQRNSFITSALYKRCMRRIEMPSGEQEELPIDEAERTPLQANGGSNGNGEVISHFINKQDLMLMDRERERDFYRSRNFVCVVKDIKW